MSIDLKEIRDTLKETVKEGANEVESKDDVCTVSSGSISTRDYILFDEGYLNRKLQLLIWCFQNSKDVTEGYTEIRDYISPGLTTKLYSKPKKNSGLKEFMVHGTLDLQKEQLLKLVMNIENRKDWDETYVEHEMLEYYEESNTDVIYSVSKFPFPLTKRTYVITRTLYDTADKCTIVFSKSIQHEFPKRYRWATHIDDFESLLILKNFEPETDENGEKVVKGCHMLVTYFENPKVMIPNSYLNFLIGYLVPGILSKMVIAAKKQDCKLASDYCKGLTYITIPPYNKEENNEL